MKVFAAATLVLTALILSACGNCPSGFNRTDPSCPNYNPYMGQTQPYGYNPYGQQMSPYGQIPGQPMPGQLPMQPMPGQLPVQPMPQPMPMPYPQPMPQPYPWLNTPFAN